MWAEDIDGWALGLSIATEFGVVQIWAVGWSKLDLAS